jgi:hypothetical protein
MLQINENFMIFRKTRRYGYDIVQVYDDLTEEVTLVRCDSFKKAERVHRERHNLESIRFCKIVDEKEKYINIFPTMFSIHACV